MSKRSPSPLPLPPAKRLHSAHTARSDGLLSFADSLYDELILTIFSYLSSVDLCTAQLINRNWSRLAVDNELWRRQYLQVYGRPRLRGTRGFPGRLDSREIKSLPARARVDDHKDWKWMFRISSNWQTGRCSVQRLPSAPRIISSSPPDASGSEEDCHSHLLLAGSLTITASSRPSHEPTIYISGPMESRSLSCRPRQDAYCNITALAIDQSPPISGNFRVVSFLSTGEFIGYRFNHNLLSVPLQIFSHIAGRGHLPPVTQAAYHHPLLVTLSQDFTISLYNLKSGTVRLTQTLSSFTSFPPVSLVLSTPSPNTYKLILAYAIPVYPRHWTAGATELIISGFELVATTAASPPSSPSTGSPSPGEELTVLSTRTARAVDVPFDWIDERKLRIMRDQWSRKVIRVADIQTDGKWVILAPGDQLSALERHLSSSMSAPIPLDPSTSLETLTGNTNAANTLDAPFLHSSTSLQLYRLIFPPRLSITSSPPRLSFVRTLHGQTGPIAALALSDGRCVSLGLNGSIWVWDLESGTGVEVAAVNLSSIHSLVFGPGTEPMRGSVSFDERRLIIAQGDSVTVRRFDI